MQRRPLAGAIALAAIALGGCVFLPYTTSEYDARCDITRQHMVLRPYQVDAFLGCQNEGCAALLVLAGAVTAASAVISGSVAVVGDSVYWLEAQGQCRER
ncbi:hypothetical protein [Thauera sp. 2A1]|uniref:hypothetical protein n=1 Tax=Thauera sp. 2A1 TaxID=2570191 RepID=UPI001290CFCE|nr:hypothetical protein [Thauera sp. 2A1]KAI5915847.1 hypothetical protein GH664_05405 [Thauera sp. 2A1]